MKRLFALMLMAVFMIAFVAPVVTANTPPGTEQTQICLQKDFTGFFYSAPIIPVGQTEYVFLPTEKLQTINMTVFPEVTCRAGVCNWFDYNYYLKTPLYNIGSQPQKQAKMTNIREVRCRSGMITK